MLQRNYLFKLIHNAIWTVRKHNELKERTVMDRSGTEEDSGPVNWLSEEERMVDALALRADERRDKLRKASGSCK